MSAAVSLQAGTLVVSSCLCGREWTEAQWTDLPCIGVQKFDDELFNVLLELRNCPCGSTHGVWRNDAGQICDENGVVL